jgi:hypothetical protein
VRPPRRQALPEAVPGQRRACDKIARQRAQQRQARQQAQRVDKRDAHAFILVGIKPTDPVIPVITGIFSFLIFTLVIVFFFVRVISPVIGVTYYNLS